MSRRRRSGMTLVELLVAMAGMGVLFAVTYTTLQRSLVLEQQLRAGWAAVSERCALAERFTGDFHEATSAERRADGALVLRLRDGTRVEYVIAPDSVTRRDGTRERSYRAREGRLAFRTRTEAAWTDAPGGDLPVAVRLRFPDTELVVTRTRP